MNPNFRLIAAAAAVATAYAAPAGATTLFGAGASAVSNTLKVLILKDYCSSASAITYLDNGSAPASAGAAPGGGVYRITCLPVTGTKFTSGLDITYDTTGGSWKAFTATNSALLTNAQNTTISANPVSTVLTTCTATSTAYVTTINSNVFTINFSYGCTVSALPTTATVTFGLTDVEGTLFLATSFNQPLRTNTWQPSFSPSALFTTFSTGTEAAGFPAKAFGVVFGVAASKNLYSALQVDQLSSGALPSTIVVPVSPGSSTLTTISCTAGTVSAACAPTITSSQYASIVGLNFNSLNTNASALFTTVVPADVTLELARRDQGSGTQGGSNGYFLNAGCTSSTTEALLNTPALPSDAPGYTITYNATTGGVITRLAGGNAQVGTSGDTTFVPATPTSGFVIGVVSGENLTALKGGAGFLKLDGQFPTNTNAAVGLYNYVTDEQLHCSSTATSGDAQTLCKDLAGTNTGAQASTSVLTYTGTGIVQLSTAKYDNSSSVCNKWVRGAVN